jgi:hypothetical protein
LLYFASSCSTRRDNGGKNGLKMQIGLHIQTALRCGLCVQYWREIYSWISEANSPISTMNNSLLIITTKFFRMLLHWTEVTGRTDNCRYIFMSPYGIYFIILLLFYVSMLFSSEVLSAGSICRPIYRIYFTFISFGHSLQPIRFKNSLIHQRWTFR